MGVSGNLRTMLPGDLLQWLSLGRKTGTLIVTRQAVEKKIFFKEGRVISSASNDPREYLGQFLMSHGFVTEDELKKAMEVQAQSGILLGKILVMIDVIGEPDLQRLMRLKAQEEIYDIFLWQEGEFHFIDDELPKMQMVPLQVDVTGIIMEGTRRVDEWSRIRELIPDESMVPVIDVPIEPDADLNEVQVNIAGKIDGRRTIAEIVLESRASAFTVSQTMYHLVREGYVRMEEKLVAPAADIDERAVTAPLPAVVVEEDADITSLLNGAQNAIRSKDFEKAQRLLRAAQSVDPNHPKVRTAIKGSESVILNELAALGVSGSRVPRVAKSLEEITKMDFSPNEGFILSRVNGQWDIGSLIKISPIREPEAMLIFYKLWKEGMIEF